MKVVFTGLPYFTSKFVKDLKSFDKKNTYVFCDTYTSKLDKIKFGIHAINADLVISINGVTSESGALNLALKYKKNILLQWQGTDVLSVQINKDDRRMRVFYRFIFLLSIFTFYSYFLIETS